MQRIIVRADSSYDIGSGHVKRCINIAKEFKERGWQVHFICCSLDGDFSHLIEEEGFHLHSFIQEYPEEDKAVIHDAKVTLELINNLNPEIVLVDHYSLGEDWETSVSSDSYRLVVLDDFNDRKHNCDFLINQNFFTDINIYKKNLENNGITPLIGPEFALLDSNYLKVKEKLNQQSDHVKNIFIFFGGVDPDNLTTKTLKAFDREEFKRYHFEVVIGENNLHKDEIFEIVRNKINFSLHIQLENLADVIARCDIAICAGGSNTWERSCLGIPSIVITLANNQDTYTKHLHESGYIKYIGNFEEITEEDIFKNTLSLIEDKDRRSQMRKLSQGMVDGHGVQRVVDILTRESSKGVDDDSTFDGLKDKLIITVLSDENSWLNKDIAHFIYKLKSNGKEVRWCHTVNDVEASDICFILSFTKIIPQEILSKNKNNLVVHESNLPKGKGMSPMTWQVLEGKTKIVVSLFEAEEGLDSGPIYSQRKIFLDGHELNSEWREIQSAVTFDLCQDFLKNYPEITSKGKSQSGIETFYNKRLPKDSKLEISQSVEELFPLLRVVDNDRYPAFFEKGGYTYSLEIKKINNEE